MHYVVFLMDHGMRPYRDIIDINMPGAYMVEWFAIHVFGSGPSAWRAFDAASMVVVIVSAIVIAGNRNWQAGLLGGTGACAFHLSNGPIDVGQRDWFIMAFLFLVVACLLQSLRRRKPFLLLLSAVFCGIAASIKPLVFPSALLFLFFAYLVLRQNAISGNQLQQSERPVRSFLFAILAGAILPIGAVILFFMHGSTFKPFLEIVNGVTRLYVNSDNMPLPFLIHTALGLPLDLLLLFSVYIAVRTSSWRDWQQAAVLLGICAGAVLYFGQRKGWQYHKLSLAGFVILWITIQLFHGLRRQGHLKWLSVAATVFLCMLFLHKWMLPTLAYPSSDQPLERLESDLQQLGGSALSGDIQCIESVNGCINALYNLRLVQSTGFIYDTILFPPPPNQEVRHLQETLLANLQQRHPRVLVLMSGQTEDGSWKYDRIDLWPSFKSLLASDYSLQAERNDSSGAAGAGSYRLYIHK